MIIEITDDGHGAWNLTAKTGRDAWPPMYMAYGCSAWAIKALVHGILTDHAMPHPTDASDPQTAADGSGVLGDGSGNSEAVQTISDGRDAREDA